MVTSNGISRNLFAYDLPPRQKDDAPKHTTTSKSIPIPALATDKKQVKIIAAI